MFSDRSCFGEARESQVGKPGLAAELVIYESALMRSSSRFLSTPTLACPEVRRLALLQGKKTQGP